MFSGERIKPLRGITLMPEVSRSPFSDDRSYRLSDAAGHSSAVTISPIGERLVRSVPGLLSLLIAEQCPGIPRYSDHGGEYATVVRLSAGSWFRRVTVSLKEPRRIIDLDGRDSNVPALEQYLVIRWFQQHGFATIPVIAATAETNRLLALWVEASHPLGALRDEFLVRYFKLLEKCVPYLEQLLGKNPLRVDHNEINYLIGDLSSADLQRRFVMIDPIYNPLLYLD